MQILVALIMLALCGQAAHAGTLTADLNCLIVGANTLGACPGSTSYGTVTLDNLGAPGTIDVTVDLVGSGMKFRDLMLNFDPMGSVITGISSSDGQPVTLSPNSYSIPPYFIGLFDVGSTGAQGWNGDNPYTTKLSGIGGGTLTLAMFDVLDASGTLDVALHTQPPTGDSLKVGGLWEGGGGGGGDPIPEPASAALLGSGMIVLVWALRRRKAS